MSRYRRSRGASIGLDRPWRLGAAGPDDRRRTLQYFHHVAPGNRPAIIPVAGGTRDDAILPVPEAAPTPAPQSTSP